MYPNSYDFFVVFQEDVHKNGCVKSQEEVFTFELFEVLLRIPMSDHSEKKIRLF